MSKPDLPVGYITDRTVRYIRGFVFNFQDSDSLLELYIDDQKIEDIALDNKNTAPGDRRIPFEIDLWTYGIFHEDEEINVRFSARPLVLAPNIAQKMRVKRSSEKGGERSILLLHIPKTGGTSLRLTLAKNYGKDQMFPSPKELRLHGGKYFSPSVLKEKIEADQHRVFVGHYHATVMLHFPKKPFTICMLRNPVDQILSLAKHFKTNNPDWKNAEIEVILQDKIEDNPQTRIFIPPKIEGEKLDRQDLNIAKNTLKNLSYVGIFEHLDRSTELLEAALDQPLSKLPWKNKSKNTSTYSHLRSSLEEKTALDAELYAYAADLFEARYARHSSADAKASA